MPFYPPRMDTVGILLAAGISRRMGTPKPLLSWQGEPLVCRMARTLRDGGVERVVVVVGPDDTGSAIIRAITGISNVGFIVNPIPERGMLSSTQAGMQEAVRNLPKTQAWLVSPCDMPLLNPEHVAAVLAAWDGDARSIIAPTYNGKRGHPTLFSNSWTTEILVMDSAQVGLNTLLAAHPTAVREVSMADAAIVYDADTPAEWQALLESA